MIRFLCESKDFASSSYIFCDFACFDKKFYVDIGLDDKYGFEPQTDWRAILEYIDNNF